MKTATAPPADPPAGYVTREELETWFDLPPEIVNHFRACECLPAKFDERTKRYVFHYASAVKFLTAIGAIEAPTEDVEN